MKIQHEKLFTNGFAMDGRVLIKNFHTSAMAEKEATAWVFKFTGPT